MAKPQVQLTLADESEEYRQFVEKFKPKKTTDDCYTPAEVYDAVAEWVSKEYGVRREDMVRPFWPGGDYEREEYPEGCCVVDNPPFSILAAVCRFYNAGGIRFFLFAPGLTCFNKAGACAVTTMADIIYENGANVRTSFLTNMEPGCVARTAPDLTRSVEEASRLAHKASKESPLLKYEYPPEVVTAATMGRMSLRGCEFRLMEDECVRIGALDAQLPYGKSIFGGGYLMTSAKAEERRAEERRAEERKAEERRAAGLPEEEVTVWRLSDRERAMLAMIEGRRDAGQHA